MSAALFLALIFFILAVWLIAWFIRRCDNHQAKTETQTYTFTADMKYGKLVTLISYEQTPENLFEKHSTRIINLWAIEREERKNSKPFQLALEAELIAHFPTCFPRVMSAAITPDVQEEKPEIPPVQTLAEHLVKQSRSRKDAIIALLSEDYSDVPEILIENQSLRVRVEEDIKSTITDILYHPDRP